MQGKPSLVRDPVCGMKVDPQQARWREEHDGHVYFFCNPRCAGKFRLDPEHYVEALNLVWEPDSPREASASPRRARVRRKYRRNAAVYDLLVAPTTAGLRRAAVSRLRLHEGERVLDLGCGTGLSLPMLRDAVGAQGAIFGVDLSPDMLAVARRRCAKRTWTNVHLIEADADRFELPEPVDALLCFYANDIVLSDTALPRALRFVRSGGRVVLAGAKLARGWRGRVVNPLTRAYSATAITRALVHEPYSVMRRSLADFRVEERGLGSQYLATGVRLSEPRAEK